MKETFPSFTSMRLVGSAMPLPAMSKAVPWSTGILMTGNPLVTFVPDLSPPALEDVWVSANSVFKPLKVKLIRKWASRY